MELREGVVEVLREASRLAGVEWGVVERLLGEALSMLESRGVVEPGPGEVLDAVEHVSMLWGLVEPVYRELARHILLYRIYSEAGRRYRGPRGVEARLSYQALRLLYSRYLARSGGRVRETPDMLFERVSMYIAQAEARHGSSPRRYMTLFLDMMRSLRFLPNTPTLMNAGMRRHQLAACFVVPVEDDMEAILDSLRVAALITKTGAGVGFDFSKLRPRGDYVEGGRSSGPVSFMELFDAMARVMKEGGRRRGAFMGILHDWHPDIMDFIESKCSGGGLENFNISIAASDELLGGEGEWRLYNPRTCREVLNWGSRGVAEASRNCSPAKVLDRGRLLRRVYECAWASGDPGMVFIDTINRHNPTPRLGAIHATNPCGETPLLDWEACNLGSLNLYSYVDGDGIDWDALGRDARLAVRFLDDVIEMSWYPDRRIEEAVLRTRKIGLGVMGLADMLAALRVRYDSVDALYLADHVMEYIAYNARDESNRLARERDSYPEFPWSIHNMGRFNWEPQTPAEEIYDPDKASSRVKRIISERPNLDWEAVRRDMTRGTRNATVTTIAPTGSISIIAGVNSSIEPFFALAYIRETSIGRFIEVNRFLEEWMREGGGLDRDRILEIARGGAPPGPVAEVLRTAHGIEPEWHVRMQAVFQRWVDNAVSKTVNLRSNATVEDVERVYRLAWRLGCKGITVFRDKSRPRQVLAAGREIEEVLKSVPEPEEHRDKVHHKWLRIGRDEIPAVPGEYAGGCPTCQI